MAMKRAQPRSAGDVVIPSPPAWSRRDLVVLLLCSGPRPEGDIGWHLDRKAVEEGFKQHEQAVADGSEPPPLEPDPQTGL